ncbi:DUF6508 domain-containing protein [Geodermatophilus sp. SYSU D00697]
MQPLHGTWASPPPVAQPLAPRNSLSLEACPPVSRSRTASSTRPEGGFGDTGAVVAFQAEGSPGSGDADDAHVIGGLRTAGARDRARLRAAVEAVRHAPPPLAEWHGGAPNADGVIQLPFPVHHPAVDELVTALGRAHAVTRFDRMHWQGGRRYPDAAAVRRAPVADAVRLVTMFVRGERFADGTIAAAVEDGRLLAAAQRILDEW